MRLAGVLGAALLLLPSWLSGADLDGREAVVRVTVVNGRQMFLGTGTWAQCPDGRTRVVTARHVTDGGTSWTITDSRGTWPARLFSASQTEDVAVLETDNPPSFGYPIADRVPSEGEEVYCAGLGGDGVFKCNFSRVCQIYQRDGLVIEGAARHGTSGGPVLDRAGDLVGVIWGTTGEIITATPTTHVVALFRRTQCPGGACPGGPCPPGGQGLLPWGRRPPRREEGPRATVPPPPVPSPVPPMPRPCEPEQPGCEGWKPVPQPEIPSQPPTLPIPSVPDGKDKRLDDLEKAVEGLRVQIAAIPAGPSGPAGPPGPPGAKGDSAPPAQIDVQAIAASIVKQLPPIYVRQVDMQSGEETVSEVHLGEGFTFRKFPHTKPDPQR